MSKDDDSDVVIVEDEESGEAVKAVLQRFISDVKQERGPLAFTHSDVIPFLIPSISVDEVGVLPLPLTDLYAAQVKKVAHLAPFGKGTETVVDTSVRHTFEIKPDKVKFVNQQLTVEIQNVVDRMAKTLHVQGPVHAELHRLLMYEKDSKFLPHRDTEKRPGMFGTLVVALPCADTPEGGELVVSHGKENKVFTCSAKSSGFECFGFFCNCLHEIKPLRGGRRLTLVFNVMANPSSVRLPSDAEISIIDKTRKELEDLLVKKKVAHPPYFALVLEHSYSPQSLEALGSAALKGSDAALAGALSKLRYVDFAVGTLDINGTSDEEVEVDYYSYKRRRWGGYRRDWDDYGGGGGGGNASFEDLSEVSIVLSNINPLQGDIAKAIAKAKDRMNLDTDAFLISLKEQLEDASPDVTGGEYTGNYAEPYEYHYSVSAMIIWTNESIQAALTSLGPAVFASHLQGKLQHWRGHKDDLAAKKDCYELLKAGLRPNWRDSFQSQPFVGQGIVDLNATELLGPYIRSAPLTAVAQVLPSFFGAFEKEQVATFVCPMLLDASRRNNLGSLCCAFLRCYDNPQQENRTLGCFKNVLLGELEAGYQAQQSSYSYYNSSPAPSAKPEALLDAALTHLPWSKLRPAIQAGLDLMAQKQKQSDTQSQANPHSYYPSSSSREPKQKINGQFLLKLIRSAPPEVNSWLSQALRPWLSEWFDFSADIVSKFELWYGKSSVSTIMVERFTKMISNDGFSSDEELARNFLDLLKLGYASPDIFKQVVGKVVSRQSADYTLVHSYLEKLSTNESAASTFATTVATAASNLSKPMVGYNLLVGMLRIMIPEHAVSAPVKYSAAVSKILLSGAEEQLNRHSAAVGKQEKPKDWALKVPSNAAGIPSDIIRFMQDPTKQEGEFRYTQKGRDRDPVFRALRAMAHPDLSVHEVRLMGKNPFGIHIAKSHTSYNRYLKERQDINQHVATVQKFRTKLGMNPLVNFPSMGPSSAPTTAPPMAPSSASSTAPTRAASMTPSSAPASAPLMTSSTASTSAPPVTAASSTSAEETNTTSNPYGLLFLY